VNAHGSHHDQRYSEYDVAQGQMSELAPAGANRNARRFTTASASAAASRLMVTLASHLWNKWSRHGRMSRVQSRPAFAPVAAIALELRSRTRNQNSSLRQASSICATNARMTGTEQQGVFNQGKSLRRAPPPGPTAPRAPSPRRLVEYFGESTAHTIHTWFCTMSRKPQSSSTI
jgi:hypothetical protein